MRSLLKQVLMVLVLWLLAVSAFSGAPLTGYAITEPFSVIPNRITIQKPTDKGEKLRNNSTRKKAAQQLAANQVSFAAVAKPDIKYTTPNIYIRNTAIPALAPTNTGGAVPATIYGETKVFAGTGQFGAANGDVTTAQFKLPYGISVDDDGNIYISEAGGGGIRMISAAGQVSSLGTDGLPGAPFNVPKFNNPHGVVKDKNGNLFVANFNNHNILKVTPSGTVSVFAGVLFAGTADGPGNVANIISPNGIAIDKDDNLYVSDGNNAIRKISPAGYVYTLAGQRLAGAADGQGRAAKFNHPGGLVLDKDGNIYVADQSNFSIRKITPNGFVTTVAGGTFGYADGVGAAAQFQHPTGITIDQSGNLYVMDTNNGTVRRITPDGEVKTIAGGGPVGVESGVGTDVHFSESYGIAMGPDGNLYVAEYGKNSIKQVVATGYTIDKPLPAGLTFNPRTGIITGTPTVLWPRTDYTVTAYNAGGSSKFILTIEVNDAPQPVIAVSNVTGSSTACAGSASADYQQFNISASNLTGSVTVIPTSNFEVSLTNSNYGVSLGMAAAYVESQIVTIYVRLSPTAPAGSQTGDVIVRSGGVADLHVPVSGMVKQVVTPTVTVSQKDLSICSNQPITFVATSTDEGINPVYQWYVNNLPQGGNTKEFTAPASTLRTDKITVSLTNTSDCANQPSVQSAPVNPVTVSNSPDLEVVSVSGLPVCEGTDQTFKANSSNPGINPGYAWQINGAFVGGGSDTFTTNVLKTGDILSCTLTNAEACNVPVTANLTIQTEAPPTVTFNGEVSIKKGESIALSPVLSGNIVTYSWSPSAGLSNDAIKNPTASPGSTTVYTLKVKNAGGCENSATIKVNVTAPVVVTAKPDITYTTPNIYIRNITIPALSPTNTGGAVPATIYSETKVIAGTGQLGSVNGDAATAQFKLPYGISVDADGNIYIAESGAGIRMINTSGQVSSIGTDALPGPPFNVPKLNGPRGVVKDKAGNLFVANYNNHNILKITPAGVVTVFAGINQSGTADGPGNVANIIYPNGIAIDKDDNLYVTDGNNAIRKISPSGYVYTLAGQPAAGTLDGQGRAAKFNKPGGIAVDNDGNVYVADLAGFVIRKITPNGYVSTIAGNGTYGSRDGIGTAAGFQSPKGITVDASGNVYVTENGVGVIRRISPDGEVKTIAGGGPNGVNSGVGTDVNFGTPESIAIGPDGNLYVAEYGKNTIKQVIATGYTIDKALPAGLIFDPRTGIITGTPTVLWPRTDYKVTAYNAGGSDKFVLSIEVNDVAPPEIGVGDVSGVIAACFGSVSTKYQQFAVSEVNLADDVLVTAPANFEVSLSPNGGYSNSLIIPLTDLQLPPDGDGITVYVRSAASAPVGNPTGNVTLKSTGATDVQVPVSGVIKSIVTPAVTAEQKLPLVCPGQPVTFVAKPTNAGVNPVYQWYVNNNAQGTNSDEFTPATINIADKITIKLTNTSDCTTSPSVTSAPISPVYNPQITPTVTAEQKLPVGCPGQPVTFVAKPGNAGVNPVYQWYVNNTAQGGNTIEFTPVTIIATDKVTVKLTNTSDCTTSPSVTSAPISPAYSPQITPTVTAEQKLPAGCPDQAVTFVAKPGNAGVNPVYQWYVNNIAQGGNTIEFTPVTIIVTDKVTVKLTNTSDCTNQPSVTSTPISPVYNPQITPTVTAEQKLPAGCAGQPVTFVAKPGNAGVNPVYQWYINNNEQGGNTVEFTPVTITATDKVTVKLTNTSDCTNQPSVTSTPISPVYNPQITPTVTAEQKLPAGCAGQPVTFVAKPGNAGVNPVYQWYVNNNAQGGNTIEFTPGTIAGTDQVTVKLTNTSDCTTSPSVTSAPIQPIYSPQITPTVTISSPSVYPVCEGTEQTFTAVPSNAGSNPNYQWQINGNNVGSNNNQFTSNTLKNGDVLICIVSNASQCVGPGTSDGFNIQTNALPTVAFNGDVFIKKGESIVLVPIVSPGITTYSWSPSAGLSNSGIQNPAASPTVTTTYTLTVTATGGCPASASIKVNVADQMVIPNTFTPNGDGVNDTWSIPALATYPNCRVNVYNRYGAGIFSSIGYAQNWNGSFNGYVLPAGTYYYTVDLKDGKKPLSGYVTLLK